MFRELFHVKQFGSICHSERLVLSGVEGSEESALSFVASELVSDANCSSVFRDSMKLGG